MTLPELYPHARWTHISLVLASGALFAARGAGVLAGTRWAMAPTIRRLSYSIDTALLAAAFALLFILDINPLAVAWLSTKIALLLVYIVLGTLALKRAPTLAARRLCFVAALLCYAFMLTVARAHHPWGIFAGLL